MQKLRALIVDDESHARFRIRHLLSKYSEIVIAGEARNGAEAVGFIEKNKPHLVFLDIQMPDMNGFEVISRISAKEDQPQIIFTTAFNEYALKAFEVHAVDYLLKPIDADRFNEAIEIVLEKRREGNERWFSNELSEYYSKIKGKRSGEFCITVRERSKELTIYPEEMISIHADGNYLEVITIHKKVLHRESLSELQEKLSGLPFLRVHRKVMVNTEFINKLVYLGNNEYEVTMSDGQVIRSGRSYKKEIGIYQELKPEA